MTPRHEQPTPGPALAVAARFAALVPVLTTDRLTLRAPAVGDFEAYAEVACSDRGRGLGGPMNRDDAWWDWVQLASGWMLHGHGGWTVEKRDTHDVAGFVLIGLEPGDQEPELGFIFRAAAEGHGYAHEAAIAARAWAFDTLRLPTLVSYIAADNTRSRALAERLGAHLDTPAGWDHADTVVYRHPRPAP